MSKLLFTLIMTLTSLLFTVVNTQADQILGNWKATEMENSTIKVYKASDGRIYGKIIESERKEWINHIILKQISYHSSKNEWKGQVHNPDLDITVNATITLENPGRLKLVGKKLFISKTFYWDKIELKD